MADPQLIKDCIKKKRSAQNELYRICYTPLMSMCKRYAVDDQEALLLLTSGFMKILKNLKKYREEIPFEAWIRKVQLHVIIDNYRKNKKHRQTESTPDFAAQQLEVPVVFNNGESAMTTRDVYTMLQQLPPSSREVFNLYALDGYNHREIAKMLDISEGTSKWHLSSARKKLQKLIKNTMFSLTAL